ncbi:DUF1761 domain-containing protein [Geodermatophilus sp. CPCC 206100]|uniref:DUF1761 domain-containing protein n=1 Tax=Geodermatophilus sp. CPCC 206100 TaxID=3020054 RepID=UPI003B00CC4E
MDLRRTGVAAGAAVVASGAWYAAFGGRLAELDDAYADPSTPPWLLPVEFARSATVATAVAALASRSGAEGPADAVRLGLGLWAAFPAVLLTGSVVHEKVPWQQAAIHAGDWLVKLLLIAAITGPRRSAQGTTSGTRRWVSFGGRT